MSCILFIFGSLMAYAALLYKLYWRKLWRTAPTNGRTPKPNKFNLNANSEDKAVNKLNFTYLMVMVVFFILFNLAYWAAIILSKHWEH